MKMHKFLKKFTAVILAASMVLAPAMTSLAETADLQTESAETAEIFAEEAEAEVLDIAGPEADVSEAEIPEAAVAEEAEDLSEDDAELATPSVVEKDGSKVLKAGTNIIYWGIQSGDVLVISKKKQTGTTYQGTIDGDVEGNIGWKNSAGISSVTSIVVSDEAGYVKPKYLTNWFSGLSKVESIDLSGLDTENVKDMSNLFSYCGKCKTITFGKRFTTDHVTSMSDMFYECYALESLDLSGFDTAAVTSFRNMFYWCNHLKSLDLSAFDTSNVTDMSSMFYYTPELHTLDVSDFDTNHVTDMGYMFYNSGVCKLDLRSFTNPYKVDCGAMFDYAEDLEELDISGLNTANMEFHNYSMFYSNHHLKKITVGESWSYNRYAKFPSPFSSYIPFADGYWHPDHYTSYASDEIPNGAGTYYAEMFDYSVVFDANGGKGSMSSIDTYISKVTKVPACKFTRNGYTFVEWNTLANGDGTALHPGETFDYLGTFPDEEVKLYAIWRVNQFTVSFNSNGGTGTMSSMKNISALSGKMLTKNAFKKDGYSFKEWNTKADSSGDSFADGAPVSSLPSKDGSTLKLYAQWKQHKYKITFKANGGTGTMSSLSVSYSTKKTLPACIMKKSGYYFMGWNTKADGSGTEYKDGETVSKLSSKDGGTVTLYAQWGIPKYTIVFNSNGGTGTMSSIKVSYSTKKALPANTFKKTGYTFTGWNTKADGSGKTYGNKATVSKLSSKNGAKVTLYAQWKVNKYTIKFDKNGGTGTAMSSVKVSYSTKKTLPAVTYKKSGYVFDSWNTKADGSGKSFGNKEAVSKLSSKEGATVTLYAQWRKSIYSISFKANGGTGSMSTVKVSYNTKIVLAPNTFKRTGYTFTGWNTKADGSGTSYANKATVTKLTSKDGATVALYAQWKINSYTITFDANGGNGTMNSVKVAYNTKKQLPSNKFTRSGAEFTEWNTRADGTGKSYANGETVSKLASKNGATVTLYAQWKVRLQPANGGRITLEDTGFYEVALKGIDLSKEMDVSSSDNTVAEAYFDEAVYSDTGKYDCLYLNAYSGGTVKIIVTDRASGTTVYRFTLVMR